MHLGEFLKKKELGLPVWAWALVASVLLFLLYRHYKNAAASSAGAQGASVVGPGSGGVATNPGGGGDSGGGGSTGGAADNSAVLAQIASGLDALAQGENDVLSALQGLGTTPPDTTGSTGSGGDTGGGASGGNSSPTTPVAGSGGGIQWGGQTFTTRAQFDAWLKARGLGWKEYALKYPKAYAEYLALPAGKIQTAKSNATKAPPAQNAPAQRSSSAVATKSSVKVLPKRPPNRTIRTTPPRVKGGKI